MSNHKPQLQTEFSKTSQPSPLRCALVNDARHHKSLCDTANHVSEPSTSSVHPPQLASFGPTTSLSVTRANSTLLETRSILDFVTSNRQCEPRISPISMGFQMPAEHPAKTSSYTKREVTPSRLTSTIESEPRSSQVTWMGMEVSFDSVEAMLKTSQNANQMLRLPSALSHRKLRTALLESAATSGTASNTDGFVEETDTVAFRRHSVTPNLRFESPDFIAASPELHSTSSLVVPRRNSPLAPTGSTRTSSSQILERTSERLQSSPNCNTHLLSRRSEQMQTKPEFDIGLGVSRLQQFDATANVSKVPSSMTRRFSLDVTSTKCVAQLRLPAKKRKMDWAISEDFRPASNCSPAPDNTKIAPSTSCAPPVNSNVLIVDRPMVAGFTADAKSGSSVHLQPSVRIPSPFSHVATSSSSCDFAAFPTAVKAYHGRLKSPSRLDHWAPVSSHCNAMSKQVTSPKTTPNCHMNVDVMDTFSQRKGVMVETADLGLPLPRTLDYKPMGHDCHPKPGNLQRMLVGGSSGRECWFSDFKTPRTAVESSAFRRHSSAFTPTSHFGIVESQTPLEYCHFYDEEIEGKVRISADTAADLASRPLSAPHSPEQWTSRSADRHLVRCSQMSNHLSAEVCSEQTRHFEPIRKLSADAISQRQYSSHYTHELLTLSTNTQHHNCDNADPHSHKTLSNTSTCMPGVSNASRLSYSSVQTAILPSDSCNSQSILPVNLFSKKNLPLDIDFQKRDLSSRSWSHPSVDDITVSHGSTDVQSKTSCSTQSTCGAIRRISAVNIPFEDGYRRGSGDKPISTRKTSEDAATEHLLAAIANGGGLLGVNANGFPLLLVSASSSASAEAMAAAAALASGAPPMSLIPVPVQIASLASRSGSDRNNKTGSSELPQLTLVATGIPGGVSCPLNHIRTPTTSSHRLVVSRSPQTADSNREHCL